MKTLEFNRIAKANNVQGNTLAACRLVLVKGKTAYAASKESGVPESTISRALNRLKRPVCKRCGQVIK